MNMEINFLLNYLKNDVTSTRVSVLVFLDKLLKIIYEIANYHLTDSHICLTSC